MTLDEKLETLFNITCEINDKKKELEPIQKDLRKLQQKEKHFKDLILNDMKISGQSVLSYKTLKLYLSTKCKSYTIKKKDDKIDSVYTILQSAGVSDPYEITKNVINSLSKKEQVNALKIKKLN